MYEPSPIDLLEHEVEFLRVYGRRFHQKREEDLLFPALVRRGVPSVGNMAEILERPARFAEEVA